MQVQPQKNRTERSKRPLFAQGRRKKKHARSVNLATNKLRFLFIYLSNKFGHIINLLMSNRESSERQALHVDENKFGRKYKWKLPGKVNIKELHQL